MLAPGWLTLADASGESDRPLTRTGTIGLPRAQQSRRARGDDCIARTMRKPALTKLPAVAALLLSSDLRLLVRHGWGSGPRRRGSRQPALTHCSGTTGSC